MKHRILKLGTAITVAVASVAALVGTAAAATPTGTAGLLATASGNATTNFSIAATNASGGVNCSGNNTTAPQIKASTFIVGTSVDPTTLTYGIAAFPASGNGATFSAPLSNSLGTNVLDGIALGSSPNFSIGGQTVNFSNLIGNTGLTNGSYYIGLACYQASGTSAGSIDPGNTANPGPRFWQSPITISNVTATGFTWQFGTPVTGVVLTNGTNVDSGANLTVTIPAANPPVSSASITGTGFTTINLSAAQITAAAAAGGTTIAVTGLTNGTTYNLTLSATNGVGSPATATASVTPAAVALNNVTGVNVTGVTASAATVNWSIPAANTTVPGTPAPTGYSVTVTSTTTGATGTGTFTPTPNVGTATSLTLSGLSASGNYSVTVTAVYSAAVLAANPLSAAPAGVGFAMQSNAVIYQDIQVNKPNGLLVMTQRCYANPSATSGTAPTWTITTPGTTNVLPVVGNSTANGPLSINGPIAAQSATQAGKGFPTGIPATPATSLVKNGTLDGQTTDLASSAVNGPGNSGVAPIISATPFDGTSTPWSGSPGTAGTDPLFSANASLLSGYPFPTNADGSLPTTNYGTRCSLNLGNAHLVTTGANAGQYFAASGQIDQITVVNTQDTDAGYSVTGQVSSFLNTVQTGGGNRSFSGDYLGWTPQAPAYITPGQNDGLGLKYDTQATAGPDAQQGVPSTVGTLAAPSNVGGLANAKTLVSSPSGHSLGIVQADARLRLIIPTSVVSGVYHGTLTFQAFG